MIEPQDGPELPDDLIVTTTSDSDAEVRAAYGIAPRTDEEQRRSEDDSEDEAKPEDEAEDEAEEEAEAPAKKPAEEPPAPPKKKESWRERSDRIKAEATALREQRRTLQREVEELAAKRTALAAEPTPAAPAPKKEEPPALTPRPRFENFETTELYEAAMDAWDAERATQLETRAAEATRKEIAALAAQQAEAEATRARTEQVAAYKAQCADFRAEHADFDTVVAQNDAVQISGLMETAVLESESGAAIAYWLGQHPDEAQLLTEDTLGLVDERSTPQQIRKAIDFTRRTLESRVAAPAAVRPPAGPGAAPKHRSAPKPMPPVGGGAPASTVRDDELDIDAYMAKRDREEAVAAGRL